jgi:hypothetical protein
MRSWTDDAGNVAFRVRGVVGVKQGSPEKVMVKRDLYTLDLGAGPDDFIESALSEVEGTWPRLLASVREGETPKRGSSLRRALSHYMAIQWARTPEQHFRVLFHWLAIEFADEYPIRPETMRRFLRERAGINAPSTREVQAALDYTHGMRNEEGNNQRTLVQAKVDGLGILFQSVEPVAAALDQLAWSIEMSKTERFITSDAGIVRWRKKGPLNAITGIGVGNSDEVRFPIDPSHLLVMRPKFPQNRGYVDADRVWDVNRHTASHCHRIILSRPDQSSVLGNLPLAPTRPAIRLYEGPLLDRAGNATMDTGHDVIHTFVPETDEQPTD